MRNWGSVCHSWFDFSFSLAHLRCCFSTIGRRGELLSLKEIPVSDRSDTFMTLKKCLCGGEVETFFFSKSCSGSIAQSIKSLFTVPTEGGSKIFFGLQLQWLSYADIWSSHTLHSRGEEKSLFFVSLSLSLCSNKSLTFFGLQTFSNFFQKISLNWYNRLLFL